MATLRELRAQLVREQAELLRLDTELRITPAGTREYGVAAGRVQQQRRTIEATRGRIRAVQPGQQSTLL